MYTYSDYMEQLRIVNKLHRDAQLYAKIGHHTEAEAAQRELVEAELKLSEITAALRQKEQKA